MISSKGIIAPIVGVLIITTACWADMVSSPELVSGGGLSPAVCCLSSRLYTSSLSLPNSSGVADLSVWPLQFLPEKDSDAQRANESKHPQALTDGTSSLSLCLSALLGLGLCSSAHWVKKLSFGVVPEWYHNGGPFQIGHSHAVNPNTLCNISVSCFIQPDYMVEDILLQYRLKGIVFLWRKSQQFIIAVLAPRGPPNSS